MDVPVGDLAEHIPSHDERRIALVRDSFASVDSFRILVLAAFKFLFGMNVCFRCPDCNTSKTMQPCQDVFGCSATAEGGFAGRAEAAFTSIEKQKATGSLHAHSQVFIQCLHQHMPLIKVFEFLKSGTADVVQRYLRYKTHVCRQARILLTGGCPSKKRHGHNTRNPRVSYPNPRTWQLATETATAMLLCL